MSASLIEKTKVLLNDRRVQIGAIGLFTAVALGGLAVGGLASAEGKPDPARPELADRARLAIEMQQVRQDHPAPTVGKLATLDPSQIQRAETPPQPVDPELLAVMRQSQREQAAALAEQRAFDARTKADLDEALRPTPAEPPRQQGGSTSNSLEPADEPGN